MVPERADKRFRMHTWTPSRTHQAPGCDCRDLLAEVDDEGEALAFAEEKASVPHPGAGGWLVGWW